MSEEEKKQAVELDDSVHAEAAAHNAHAALARANVALTEAYGIRLVIKERELQAAKREAYVLRGKIREVEAENRALTEALAKTQEILAAAASPPTENEAVVQDAVPAESPTRVDAPKVRRRRRAT